MSILIESLQTRVPAGSETPNPVWLVTARHSDAAGHELHGGGGHRLVGSLTLEMNMDPADKSRPFAGWVANVFVAEDARGRGIASRMFAEAREICERAGCGAMGLVVTHDNPARALYERLGFIPCWPTDEHLIAHVLPLREVA